MTKAHELEDIMVAKVRGKWKIQSNLWQGNGGKLEFFWFVYLRPVGLKILSIVCASLSLLIVYGESTLFVKQDVSPLRMLFERDLGVLANELCILIPLVYIIIASHNPLFSIRLEGIYGLYRNRNTQPGSLIYSACFLARLMPIIVYNFLMLIRAENTDFMELIDYLNFMPQICVKYFLYFPMILGLLCIMNILNLYNKFVRVIGLRRFEFEEELKAEKKVEGKIIIAKERTERERNIRHIKVSESKSKNVSLLGEYEKNYSVSSVNS